MAHKIQRINNYNDKRFDHDVLNQHGAFIIDEEYKCSFNIINDNSAMVVYDEGIDISDVIEEFRFYSEHIINFYDRNNILIKSFQPMELFNINIEDIQPSQFFVDQDKVRAIGTFINESDQIIIPVMKIGTSFVSLDGHTRLYYATTKGYSTVKAYFAEGGAYIKDFVQEARVRGVFTPKDLKLLSHEEYEAKWHKFCDDFFAKQ